MFGRKHSSRPQITFLCGTSGVVCASVGRSSTHSSFASLSVSPQIMSFIQVEANSDFPIQNLLYGVFSTHNEGQNSQF
ncbi:hypothetical protein XELAEV_18020393mg [Xenopus laevis]|uniref:Uncharacterized protein n=1 Tax=Xenopus laevis TaxID=8355 RepID=A0A974HQK9_XENLA|nr:hypothetical protein XELAEV_18020393mg [Xenopus laevis]